MKNKKMIFLLGGYDLEMIEIKKILENNNIDFIDKNLSWGAKLSDYLDEIEKYKSTDVTIYGIELEVDISLPKNYKEIDHHNENSNKPSSIEQVADILDIKLSRHQMLVDKNDSGFIDGMKLICATDTEIQNIRALDRQSQGITQDDEDLAEKSIKYETYIIYNDTKVVFYGYKIENIINFLTKQNISKDCYYYGGGKFGFLGIKDKILDKQEIKKLIKGFKKMEEENEQIYSYHTFMLPFSYATDDKKNIIKDWTKSQYDMGYNEKVYFHKFFLDSIISAEFYTKTFENNEFVMCKSQEYKLTLDSTNLRLFDKFNIGILIINLKNKNYHDSKTILEINDFTRRLYPEYLDYEKGESGLVPNFMEFNGKREDFKFDKDLKEPKISKIIDQFIPTSKIKKAVDDRMFTISFYNNPALANQLKDNYTCNDKWYEYIFIDGNGKCVQDNAMQIELIKKATYSRWKNYGTMYGMSKYSFVCLANSEFPLPHMQTMYQSMFSLLLMVRATLLKFSSEVSDIAKKLDENNTAYKVEKLYKKYIQFVNGYYFREITAKDQGLELYEQAIETLKIERDIKDLDAEIEELHKFLELQRKKEAEKEAEKMNKKLNDITIYGGILLGASVLTGFFGMNVGGENNFSWWLVIPTLILSILYGYNKFHKGES